MGLAGLLGAVAVAMGAYAAHGLAASFGAEAAERAALGAGYQLAHAAALFLAGFAAPAMARPRLMLTAGGFLAVGATIFPGALYALALGGPPAAGAVAPIGGSAMILGWLLLGAAGLGGRKPA